MINIVLPSKDTVQDWAKFISDNLDVTIGSSITYDLKAISKLRPHHLVALACLIEQHSPNVERRNLLISNQLVKTYLENIGFTDYFNREKKRPHELIPSRDKRTLNLWKLHPEMIYMYPIEAQRFYERNAFEGKDLHALNTSLSEILNNFIDHTKPSNFGFTATQLFEDQHKLETAVCDFGGGIPNKINAYFELNEMEKLSDEQALRWAMKIGNSTKSTFKNKGFGLDTLSSLVAKLNGELRIVTNRVVLFQSGNNEFKVNSLTSSFPGTLITVSLDTNFLRNKEEFELDSEELF